MFSKLHGALLVLMAVLAGLYFLMDASESERIEEEQEKVAFLDGLQPNVISRIELSRGDQERVTLVRLPENQWGLAEKDNFPVEENAIRQFMSGLTYCDEGAPVVGGRDKHEYLLLSESNGIRVKLYNGTNLAADYFIGKPGPTLGSTYVRRADSDQILMVYAALGTGAIPLERNWIKRQQWKLKDTDIASMSIQIGEDAPMVFSRSEEGAWTITAPRVLPGDLSQLRGLMASLVFLHLSAVPRDEELTMTGLENPLCQVSLTLHDGTVHTLKLGKERVDGRGHHYAITDTVNRVILVGPQIFGNCTRPLSTYVDREIWSLGTKPVALELDERGKKTRYERNDADLFVRTLPAGGGEADQAPRDQTLAAVQLLRADGVENGVDLGAFGLNPPQYTLAVATEGGGEPHLLAFGTANEDDEVFVRVPGRDVVYRLDASTVEKLLAIFRQ
jgi:hypothetical protein